MKDAFKGAAIVIASCITAMVLGWGFGQLVSHLFLNDQIKRISTPPIWYCIEGKIYEKFGDTYATVVPARSCLPVSKD